LLPVFLFVVGLEFALVFVIDGLVPSLILILVVAFELMLSFAITANMIRQIHEEKRPSLITAVTSGNTVRLIPRVFGLSIVWFALVLLIIALETALKALLSRIDKEGKLVDGLSRAVFGTIYDAIRMMGFMMIPIMLFEDLGLSEAFGRLKTILAESAVKALGGLALTRLTTTLIFLGVVAYSRFNTSTSLLGFLLMLGVAGVGWVASMYLEQMFVTGLYLYAAAPQSKVVGILLQDHLGRELPGLPAPDQVWAAGEA